MGFLRKSIPILLASLQITETAQVGLKERTVSRRLDLDLLSKQRIGQWRSLYEFDQDDLFLQHTTGVPSVSSAPTSSVAPSLSPTSSTNPSTTPTTAPTFLPTGFPFSSPSLRPSPGPTDTPTLSPSSSPSLRPSPSPTNVPTLSPSSSPSKLPTSSPTESPSASPSSSPSSLPTLNPSISPSNRPSHSPTEWPTLKPSQSPSIVPTTSPSLSKQPTSAPTESMQPSSAPSISYAPTELRRPVELSPFSIELVSVDKLTDVDDDDVVQVAEVFLSDFLKNELAAEMKFLIVVLKVDKNVRRRLNEKRTVLCTGSAVFNSEILPDSRHLDELVLTAFSDSAEKKKFLELLKESDGNFNQVLNVGAQDVSERSRMSQTHVTLIIVIVAVAVCGVAMSFLIQRFLNRGNESRFLAQSKKYYTAHENENENEVESLPSLEPQPIEISDDDRAIERGLIRSQHERSVMKKANESLRKNDSQEQDKTRSTKVTFGSNIAYGSNGTVEEEEINDDGIANDEEDATITSIQFTQSIDTAISSLGGLNTIPEDDDIVQEHNTEVRMPSPKKKEPPTTFPQILGNVFFKGSAPATDVKDNTDAPLKVDVDMVKCPTLPYSMLSPDGPSSVVMDDDPESTSLESPIGAGILSPCSNHSEPAPSRRFTFNCLEGDDNDLDPSIILPGETASLNRGDSSKIEQSTKEYPTSSHSINNTTSVTESSKEDNLPKEQKESVYEKEDSPREKALKLTQNENEGTMEPELDLSLNTKQKIESAVGQTETLEGCNIFDYDPISPKYSDEEEDDENVLDGNALEQNAQDENSYFTSIFTRRY